MKILLFVLALWSFNYIDPSDGKKVSRYYGPKGTICKQGHHWIVKIKCTNKCKIHKPKAAFERGGRVRITGRMGEAFRQKKKSCGRNCFCAKTSKPRWNQVFCKNNRGKKITSNCVHFDIWCIKRTNKLRFRAYIRNIGKPRMKKIPCPSGEKRHEDGVCRKCENGSYQNSMGRCVACACSAKGSKFQSCETTTGKCDCKDGYKDKNCDKCEDKFYKITSTGVCKACGCGNGAKNRGNCAKDTGDCTCKNGVSPPKCKKCTDPSEYLQEHGRCRKCKNGKYGTTCQDCACSVIGSKFQSCRWTGDCICKAGYQDKNCDNCEDNYYKITSTGKCKACMCNNVGTKDGGKCEIDTGKCDCKSDYSGNKCDGCSDPLKSKHEDGVCRLCTSGQYDLSGTCTACSCSAEGSKFQSCETNTGNCDCKEGYENQKCDKCKAKFYKIAATGECRACDCDVDGSKTLNCKDDGRCECNHPAVGHKCNSCDSGHYKPTAGGACKACNCNTANTVGGDDNCDDGQCNCQTGTGKTCQ